MYLLLAAIVLLLLFAASFGGRGTWVALGSTTLTVLLIAACAFIASASSAGPFFKSLAEGLPASLNGGVGDLAYAAERTAAAFGAARKPAAKHVATAEAKPDASPESPAAATSPGAGAQSARVRPGWLDFDWLDVDWLNPWNWFGDAAPAAPEVDLELSQGGEKPAAAPAPAEPERPAPRVRAMMPGHDTRHATGRDTGPDAGIGSEPGDGTQTRANAAPSYRIVTPPAPAAATPEDGLPEDAPPDDTAGAPVKWLPGAPHPQGEERIVLTGTNVSNAPLENIQATLKPDSPDGTAAGNRELRLRIEGQDGAETAAGTVPPGTRFHLQAAGLSEADAGHLKGAIVSFAYSLGGRRRTSILYLDRAALSGKTAGVR